MNFSPWFEQQSQPDLSLDQYLRLLLRGKYDQTGDTPPRFDAQDYRKMAQRMRTRADRPTYYPDPRHFAFALGLATLCQPIEGDCWGEINQGDMALYSCKGGPRCWGLRIYHGIAHWVLRVWYANEYEESDAWLLTIEMACIGDHLLVVGPDVVIAENEFVPAWLVRMYYSALRMAALLRSTAQVGAGLRPGHPEPCATQGLHRNLLVGLERGHAAQVEIRNR